MIGILMRLEFGTGGWKLKCSDGTEYELVGDVPQELEGKRVRIDGVEVEAYGFIMSGLPQLKIKDITNASKE
jgi:hypothetical protein